MAIARIQPFSAAAAAHPAADSEQEEQSVYTVWMKSLVLNGRGCTIYGQDGGAAYRVDNYACRRRREVYAMDSGGKALLKLLKKYFGAFELWQGYSCCKDDVSNYAGLEEPWFRVQKEYKVLKREGQHSVVRAVVQVALSGEVYKINGMSHRPEYTVVGYKGKVFAEMKRKQTDTGVVLGDDVMRLTVGPTADHLPIVGLGGVYCLLDHRI